jgi:hypothetical protein
MYNDVRFNVFAAVTILMLFWVKVPCGLVGRSRRFGEAYCLHLQRSSNKFSGEADGSNQATRGLNPKQHNQNV